MKEVDAVGLIINQAVNIAFEDNNVDQIDRLTRLQASYYALLAEGLQPTSFEKLSRPLRAKLGLEDIDTSQLPEVVYKTPIKDMHEIKDERLRLVIERINREFGSKLLDQSGLGHPSDDLPFWKEFSSRDRDMVSRTLNALRRNDIILVGQVRNLGVKELMTFRNMGEVKAAVALRIYSLEEPSAT